MAYLTHNLALAPADPSLQQSPPTADQMESLAHLSVNSSAASTQANQTQQVPICPIAAQFPNSKACRLQFMFGAHALIDDDDIFVSQLEKENKMTELDELNKNLTVSHISLDVDNSIIQVKKTKGRKSLEEGRKWADDVKARIFKAIGTITSEVVDVGTSAVDIQTVVSKNFCDTTLSCLLSVDQQSLLLMSSDTQQMARAKILVNEEMKKVSARPTIPPQGFAISSGSPLVSYENPISSGPVQSTVMNSTATSLLQPAATFSTYAYAATAGVGAAALKLSPSSLTSSPIRSLSVKSPLTLHGNHSGSYATVSQQVSSTVQAAPFPNASNIGGAAAGSQRIPFQTSANIFSLSLARAKVLQEPSVMLELLTQLMSVKIIIDTADVLNGKITVIQGDPAEVVKILDKLVQETTLACNEKDEEVGKCFQELREKFPAKFVATYDTHLSSFIIAFSSSVENDVRPHLLAVAITKTEIVLEEYKSEYVNNNMIMIQTKIQASFGAKVSIQMKTTNNQSVVIMSAERSVSEKALTLIKKCFDDIVCQQTTLKEEQCMYFQGAKGYDVITALENKHNVKVTVTSPWQRVLWTARSPKGHRLIVCQGNMAACDCHVTVLPLPEGGREWSPTVKYILESNFLDSKLERYAKEIGLNKNRILMTLVCNSGADVQVDALDVSRKIIIAALPQQSDSAFQDKLCGVLEEFVRKVTVQGGTSLSFPLPVLPDSGAQAFSYLPRVLTCLQQFIDCVTLPLTVILYVESRSDDDLQLLQQHLQSFNALAWVPLSAVKAPTKDKSSWTTEQPNIRICGQRDNVTAALTQIMTVDIPEEVRRRAELFVQFEKGSSETSQEENDKKENPKETSLLSMRPEGSLVSEEKGLPSPFLPLSSTAQDYSLAVNSVSSTRQAARPTFQSPQVVSLQTEQALVQPRPYFKSPQQLAPKRSTVAPVLTSLQSSYPAVAQPQPQLSASASLASLATTTRSDRVDVTTQSGIKVSVYKTDITTLTIDAIVNASNENLAHGGGVAYAISKAAGLVLEDEGRDYITRNGPLKVSEVVPTTAGNLPCLKVLHAVGPRWCDYKDKNVLKQHLVDTVFNCLEKAHQLGYRELAIPSISSAIFGVPKDVCAESYAAAVTKFDQLSGGSTRLQHVHFVDVNDEMVSEVQKTFCSAFPPVGSTGEAYRAYLRTKRIKNQQSAYRK